MQKITDFNSNLGTAIVLSGPAGGGKSVLACRLFPRTYVIVGDLNFESAKRYLEKNSQLSNVIGFDTISVDETGKTVPVSQRYDRFFRCVAEAAKNPEIDCIAVDGATQVEDWIKGKICSATTDAAIKLSNFDQWGTYLVTWKGLILQLRQSGKKLIMCVHEKKERDESDGIFKYQISLDGQIRDKFPALFSDVWRCEVQETNGKHAWMVRTLGNVRHELKNTYGLSALLPADELVQKIKEAK